MTTNQILFELAAQECRCPRPPAHDPLPDGYQKCDPCLATIILMKIEAAMRLGVSKLKHDRARIACEVSADYIAARDSEDLEIPDCEDES